MHFPQALPFRTTDIETGDAQQLAAALPERGREYIQIAAGALRATLRERAYGTVGLLEERWGCALRVRCVRPRGYVAFSTVRSDLPATWCGVALQPGDVLEMDGEWEIASRGPLESFSFAVEAQSLTRVGRILRGSDEEPQASSNRVLRKPGLAGATETVRRAVSGALAIGTLAPEARRVLEADLIHLAARIQNADGARVLPQSLSRRRLAIRRIEEFLAAHPFALPSIADLCAIAGVSERTLDYAFREQLGVPPGRYLRLRRINAVRRDLRSGDPEFVHVTEVAMRWGFWELGRFAGEYRVLFGELPSATLAGRRTRRGAASELTAAER